MAQLIAARPDVPRFGDQDTVGQQRIGAYLIEQRGVGIETIRHPPQRRAKVEAEAIHPGLCHEMS